MKPLNKFKRIGGGKNKLFFFLLALRNYRVYKLYSNQFKHYLELRGFPNVKAEGEDEYLNKWRQLTDRVEPYSYRLFSHYLGPNPNIVPEDIGHSIVEATLNPERYRSFYSDKNMYSTYIPKQNLPRTVARRINGSTLLDEDYQALGQSLPQALSDYSKVILKPTIDTNSGIGVMLFIKSHNKWCYAKDETVILDERFLNDFSNDFVIQECLTQHDELALFNPTSINTLRISAYRSVKDEQSHILGAVIRIGKAGEFVDNAHSGGRFVGLDIETGKLKGLVYDQFGDSVKEWNGINYESSHYRVPEWDKVKNFVLEVTSKLRHMRLVAFDITVNADGTPKLIELNVEGFSFWLFLFTKQNALGKYTDEIIEYCKQQRIQPHSAHLVEC
jgi:hypothetical protein